MSSGCRGEGEEWGELLNKDKFEHHSQSFIIDKKFELSTGFF